MALYSATHGQNGIARPDGQTTHGNERLWLESGQHLMMGLRTSYPASKNISI
jgi:hypothetical protein